MKTRRGELAVTLSLLVTNEVVSVLKYDWPFWAARKADLFHHLCSKLSPAACNSSPQHLARKVTSRGWCLSSQCQMEHPGKSSWAYVGSVALIHPLSACFITLYFVFVSALKRFYITWVVLFILRPHGIDSDWNTIPSLLFSLRSIWPLLFDFFSHRFIINSVWLLGFARSLQLLPKIVACRWCLAVLLLWQRLICSISDGGRNQMRLWSAGCHKCTYKLLMNSLCEKQNAFVLSVGCLVGWVDWWWVYRDIEDVKDFESESFILGCRLLLPPLLSLYVLSFPRFQSTFLS